MAASHTLPPGPRSFLTIGEILGIRRDVLGFLNHVKSYGDIACFRLGPQLVYYVSHPEPMQEVLVTNHHCFRKTWVFKRVEDALGQGMLTSTGDFHKRQRKLLQPAFHKQHVAGYMQTMIAASSRTSEGWRDQARVDMAQEMSRLTLSIVAQTLFGSDVADEADEIGRAISQSMEHFAKMKGPFAYLASGIPFLPSNMQFERAKRRVDATIYRLIATRRESGEQRNDFLAMLLGAQHEDNGVGMSDKQVRDEAVAIFLSGFETSSNTLTWAWYLLSQNPDVEAEFHRELDTVLGGRSPEPADWERLTFTRKIITETLRLYPSVYAVPRRVVEACPLGPYTTRPGALMIVGIHTVQHDARFYEEPERFMPHRWTRELSDKLPRFAFSAFGGGPHACLGEQFAWAETILVLAVLGQRWKARVVAGHTVTPDALVNLRPRNGMPMTVAHR